MGTGRQKSLDLQTVALDRAAACVRLLNLTGSVGCATPSAGVTVPLAAILSAVDLESLSTAAEAEPHAFLLAPELFTSAVVHRLQSALGPNLAGLLVLHAETQPDGAAATDPAELALGRFQFAIVLLDAADSARALSAVGALPTNATTQPVVGAAARRPLVQLRYPMQARGTARKCLWEGSCLPLGGQSVWGALTMPPMPPMPPQLRDDAGVDALVVHVRPVVLLAAQMDGTAFFHEAAPAAHAAVAGAVALLGAVAAVSDEPSLRAQLPSLPATPAFALFTGEAWGGLGSRRFARDIASFHCSAPAAVPAAPAAPSTPPPASPPAAQTPPPSACAWPYKPDRRFERLRAPERGGGGGGSGRGGGGSGDGGGGNGNGDVAYGSAVRHVLQLGPLGSVAAGGEMEVHLPTAPGEHSRAVAAALHASGVLALRDAATAGATAGDGAGAGASLPPGPARAFVDEGVVGASQAAYTGAATLTDRAAPRVGLAHGSRFDTLATLNGSLVCDAATAAARAWWRLAGGSGAPTANCSLVQELLRCLLLPEPCRLALDLGVISRLDSHYTGVFVAGPGGRTIVSPTAEFARRLLQRRILAPLLAPLATPGCNAASAPAGCEAGEAAEAAGAAGVAEAVEVDGAWLPIVALHDAYSTGIEWHRYRSAWRVTDETQPIWAESDWPAGVTASLWPASPSLLEGGLLLGLGLLSGLLTLGAVRGARHTYGPAGCSAAW